MNKSTANTKKGLNLAVIIGIALVVVGLILLAFNFGWLNSAVKSIIFSWPMLLILLALIGFSKRNRIFSMLLLLVGLFFLLPRVESAYPGILGGAGGNFVSNYWPLLLVVAGLIVIVEVVVNRREIVCSTNNDVNGNADTDGTSGWVVKDVIFGSSESIFLNPIFKGGDIDVVFGGVVLDLRKTTLPEETVYLNIDAVFGGVTLYIPDDWSVKTRFESVFGGYSDKRPNAPIASPEGSPKLILQGSLMFGGCTVQ